MEPIKLGQKATDSLTGLTGTVIARCEYLSGKSSVCIQPKMNNDGTFQEERWIDEHRIVVATE